jgi:hypothetical protein
MERSEQYQVLVIENFVDDGGITKGNRRINPRRKPDLPERIKGSAIWWIPDPSPNGHMIPPSYHIQYKDTLHPVEFINQQWYFIDWDDDQFKGFWVRPGQVISQGGYGLGWEGRIIEAETPRGPGPSFTQIRDRAESASTQAEAVAGAWAEEEEDPMDNNPEQTEELAGRLFSQSTLEGVVEELEANQPREHYLPTTLPSAEALRGVGVNPIQVRATRLGEEKVAATTEAAKLITNTIRLDGQLKGKVPTSFDGDRTKATTFMNAFDLFWMNNEENSSMKNPYKRCTYFLGLIEGPRVEDWVVDQTLALRNKVTRVSDRITKDDESLWEDLKEAFANAFSHTGKVEQAKADLARLEMTGDQIDEYIAKFENLLRKADIPRNEVTVMDKFTDGLKKGIHAAILRRDVWPTTLDEWESVARTEVRRQAITKEALGERGNYHLSTRQSKWKMRCYERTTRIVRQFSTG